MTREPPCPREPDVSRALQLGPDAALEAHLTTCASCRASWDGFQAAIGLARDLALDLPSPARREEVRASILAAAESGQARPICTRTAHLRWPAVGAAAVVAAIWILHGHMRQQQPRSHAAVHARTGAAFVMTSAPPDEMLRLRSGTLDVQVDPLERGQRFRVVVGDGEVEVRGTAFTVSADDDRLTGVSVAHGRVEVRTRDGKPAVLGPGQAWRPSYSVDTEIARAQQPEPARAPPPVLVPRTASLPAWRRSARPRERAVAIAEPSAARALDRGPPVGPTAQESLYNGAWDAMRAGEFVKAAERFAAVISAAPHGPLADEGAFWRAVATARAGRPTLAIDLFREMLDGYPSSARRGEAAAMLGWLLIDAGRANEARAFFRTAASDSSERVRTSARQGLAAIER